MKLRDANYKMFKEDQSTITWNEFKPLKNKVNNIVKRQKFLYFRKKSIIIMTPMLLEGSKQSF